MAAAIHQGECVKVPDGRIARVRERVTDGYTVRLRRKTGKSHQLLTFARKDLERVDCPKGWMSPEGYNRYLQATLAKMRERMQGPRSIRKRTSEEGRQ
jgi:hypothetical protein